MPLPEGQTKWPPEQWQEVFQLYAEHAAWYSGDPNQIASVHAGAVFTPTPRGRFWAADVHEERRVMLHVPIAGDIAATSADLLFSETPTAKIPEAHEESAPAGAVATQERLNELIDVGGVHNRLLEAAETCAALGGVYLRPVWDREVAGHPILSVVQADVAIPEFRWGVLRAVTLWRVLSDALRVGGRAL